MEILWVYCGGSHDTAADVRRCWSQQQARQELQAESAPERQSQSPVGFSARPMPSLGRNIVIRPGQRIPRGWETAEQCVVDEADVRSPGEIVLQVRRKADD